MRKIFLLAILSSFFHSCETDEILGPNANELEDGNLNITTAFASDNSTPDFASGESVNFTASLETAKEWTLTLTGSTTGAVKTFTGASGEISVNWNGLSDELPIFTSEAITATLSFPAHSGNDQILALTSSSQPAFEQTEVVIEDFNGYFGGKYNSDWPSESTADPNNYGNPDGNAFITWLGNPWHGEPWVEPWTNLDPPLSATIDFLEITPAAAGFTGESFPLLADPDNVYFNIMVYNTGENAKLDVYFNEQGGAALSTSITPYWTGWKIVSVKYSDLGVNAQNPHELENIILVLSSTDTQEDLDAQKTVFMAIDHISFTFYEPLALD